MDNVVELALRNFNLRVWVTGPESGIRVRIHQLARKNKPINKTIPTLFNLKNQTRPNFFLNIIITLNCLLLLIWLLLTNRVGKDRKEAPEELSWRNLGVRLWPLWIGVDGWSGKSPSASPEVWLERKFGVLEKVKLVRWLMVIIWWEQPNFGGGEGERVALTNKAFRTRSAKLVGSAHLVYCFYLLPFLLSSFTTHLLFSFPPF